MATRFIKAGTEVRVATAFGGRFTHGIVEQVITQDSLVVRVGRDSGITAIRMTGPGVRPNRFSVEQGN